MSERQMELSVLPLDWAEIKDIPIEQRALYFSLSFLVSELNALQRLALLSFQIFPNQPEFEAVARIQSNALIRVISGKCFEAGKFIESGIEKSRDDAVREICAAFHSRFQKLEAEKGRHVSEHVRRKMAFHLDFREAVKSTISADETVDCNCYIQQADGNCFFPAGDDVIFEANLFKAAKDAKHSILTDKDHSDWVKWATSVISLVKEMHSDVFENFIFRQLGGKLRSSMKVKIPERLIACRDIDYLPLFFRGST